MTAQPRAAIYCRVSTDRQEEEGTSLDTQQARCRQYCEQHGYHLLGAYVETYSGFTMHRPQLDRVRGLIRARAIDVLVCYDVDRWSRNQVNTAIYLHELDEAGVRIEFVTEKFEDTAVGKFILSARSFAAEIEREKIKERTGRGMRARVESGKPLAGSRPPYGYCWVDDDVTERKRRKVRLQLDPITAPIARRIFEAIANGTTLRALAAELDRGGVPTPSGGLHWGSASLRTILANPIYMGSPQAFRWSGRKANGKRRAGIGPEVERVALPADAAPALVDADIWQAAQARLAHNRTYVRRQAANPETHLLRGNFVVCGLCGSPLCAATNRRGQPVYRCGRGHTRQWECSFGGTIAAGELDSDVWGRVEVALRQPEMIAQQVARLAAQPDPAEHDLAATDKALAELERQQANLVSNLALVNGSAAALIAERLNGLEQQRQRLGTERARILARVDMHRGAMRRLDTLTRICQRVATKLTDATYEQRRLALTALGVRVTVYPVSAVPLGLDRRYRVEATIDLDATETVDAALLSRTGIGPTWRLPF